MAQLELAQQELTKVGAALMKAIKTGEAAQLQVMPILKQLKKVNTALTSVIRRGSTGFGMKYLGPNVRSLTWYTSFTTSGTGCFAKSAIAFTAASFISSLIALACTSRAPRKIYGNPITLFI